MVGKVDNKKDKIKLSSSVLYMPLLRGQCEISMKFYKANISLF